MRIDWDAQRQAFGEFLRQRRKEILHVTQETMARRIGVDQSRISRIEKGSDSPRDPPTAEIYAQCYGMDSEKRAQWFRLSFGGKRSVGTGPRI